ncbi:MAG TPA: response regulator [Candidatus Binatia bacterium]|nr:response regulator [Candidatus Binatia bacterium]
MILVVEYYDSARESLAELLRDEGYEVYEAPDDNTATVLLDQRDFDLILLNLAEPDALGLLERVQKLSATTAVLVMSEPDSKDKAVEAVRLGAQGYIMKPVVFSDLVARVRALRPFPFRR